ncbi:MAG TPA: SDR family NAD(P)-dependent oxidoreductase [Gaiella sp.]
MSDLTGRVVAITGASSGIGEATALACARAGAAVALAARRADRLEAVAARIRGEGGTVSTRVTDVADAEHARAFVEGAHDEHGRLDVLVNNAGVMHLGRIEGAPLEEWRRMIDVNVMGVLHCTHAALPLMTAQGSGDVVMVSSVGGRVTPPYSGVYCLTKWGIGAFAEVLRKETVGTGVRVIVIEPGRVESELRTHVRPEVLEELGPGFAELVGLDAELVADTIVFAVAQPPHVSFSEVLVRPTASAM